MCDYREGELIVAYGIDDTAASQLVDGLESAVGYATLVDDLQERLARSDIKWTFPLRVRLLRVPEGQEFRAINDLYARYYDLKAFPWHKQTLKIVPNSYLTLEGFTQSADYAAYKNMLGMRLGATGKGVTVAVVDTGIEPANTLLVNRVTDLFSVGGTGNDILGHGTAVANVILDVAPDAAIEIIKMTEATKNLEWDGLAGLATAATADVINLSLSFGSADRTCPTCGRQAISSRSIVFESMIDFVLRKPHEPIIVAAAGNQQKPSIRYPARFGDVVAVGAVDAGGARANYSNYGAKDADGNPHQNLFFAPGGEPNRPVGSTTTPLPNVDHYGTSLATAYASAVIACAWETRGPGRARILNDLRAAAALLPNHQATDDGNGLIQNC